MLPSPVAAQGFKAVAWKTRKIGEGDGCVEVPEAEDHRAANLFGLTMYVKRK
jgi:hypothetical protein